MATKDNRSPSGPVTSYKGNVVVAAGTIAATASPEATVSFANAKARGVVTVSPRSSLPAGLSLGHQRVVTPGIIAIALSNITTTTIAPGTISYDVVVQNR